MSELSARLYLVTPVIEDLERFAPEIEAALASGDVACVLLRLATPDTRAAKAFTTQVQARGAALLVEADTRLAGNIDADGVHVNGVGDDLDHVIRSMKPSRIVGVGGLGMRDDAMAAGESGADYLMFGETLPGERPAPFAERLDRVRWWAEIFQVPCVGFAHSLAEVEPFAEAGAEFVAVGDAVWDDPRGPVIALRDVFASLQAGSARFAAAEAERV